MMLAPASMRADALAERIGIVGRSALVAAHFHAGRAREAQVPDRRQDGDAADYQKGGGKVADFGMLMALNEDRAMQRQGRDADAERQHELLERGVEARGRADALA